MNREQVRAIALANGFKLKEQPDGNFDLNPYVYDFAAALINTYMSEVISTTKDALVDGGDRWLCRVKDLDNFTNKAISQIKAG